MRLVTASAKNHSRIRPSDSASAITTARAERLGRLLAGNNIDCEPDRFRSACKIHCHDRVGLQSFSLGRTFLGNHYGAALTEHVIGKPASKQRGHHRGLGSLCRADQWLSKACAGDPKLKIGQIEGALLRDCRFIASIEMHTKGKSVDDAIQIGSPEPEARREAYRGTRDPGYINYTVGKLEILKLRDDYLAKMGDFP
jgi:Bacterial protein of unknown function (DUF885)